MPPKKRQYIGQVHPKTRRAKVMRACETPEQRDTRVEQSCLRMSASRAIEKPEVRRDRLEEDRHRRAACRANETTEQREARVEENRVRIVQTRGLLRQSNLKLVAFKYDPQYGYQVHPNVYIGKTDIVCVHCSAKKFKGESPGMCCSNGKVKLTPLRSPPDPLKTYMSGTSSGSKHFLKYIRKYNACFQMTSFGATTIVEEGFMPTFKVQGQIYHRAGSALQILS
ncbi:hypothetical protein AVEN_174103-1 [Araneus ventricosus]|uniref:STPR domain-containing protein n=1 Tax=Araneus ventricosus TaxID=182803 RepID=A0A4Y2C3W5_ARAVE|nr:hypothetical protein AVEN_174103-1 [Araneus ventricosus]